MKTQRIPIALAIINVGLMVFMLAQFRSVDAGQHVVPVLRGRALEIVDANGRVRASITVEKAVTVDAKSYPETVLLRLSDPKNGPVVKLSASEDGSVLGMTDDADGGLLLSAKEIGSFVKVTDKRGREQVLKP